MSNYVTPFDTIRFDRMNVSNEKNEVSYDSAYESMVDMLLMKVCVTQSEFAYDSS